jgi:hypothetical protein
MALRRSLESAQAPLKQYQSPTKSGDNNTTRKAWQMHSHATKSARLIQRLTESLWCSISPAMASGSHECQFPGCDSMTHGHGLPFALFGWGVAFALKRRRRHAALASHGISSAARRARANAEARGGAPGGSEGGPAPGR